MSETIIILRLLRAVAKRYSIMASGNTVIPSISRLRFLFHFSFFFCPIIDCVSVRDPCEIFKREFWHQMKEYGSECSLNTEGIACAEKLSYEWINEWMSTKYMKTHTQYDHNLQLQSDCRTLNNRHLKLSKEIRWFGSRARCKSFHSWGT